MDFHEFAMDLQQNNPLHICDFLVVLAFGLLGH